MNRHVEPGIDAEWARPPPPTQVTSPAHSASRRRSLPPPGNYTQPCWRSWRTLWCVPLHMNPAGGTSPVEGGEGEGWVALESGCSQLGNWVQV